MTSRRVAEELRGSATYIEAGAVGSRVDTAAMNTYRDPWPNGYDAISFSIVFARLEFPGVRARQTSYSTRSALSGSTLAACRAGMTHASMAIAVSNSTTMAIVKGSVAVTP